MATWHLLRLDPTKNITRGLSREALALAAEVLAGRLDREKAVDRLAEQLTRGRVKRRK